MSRQRFNSGLALLSPLQASLSPLFCNHAYLPTHPTTTSRVGRWKEGRRARASVVVCLYANRHRNSNRRWRKEEERETGREKEGEQEARVKERATTAVVFVFQGDVSPSPLLLRRPRLQTKLKRPRASLLSSKPVGSLHFDSVGFTCNHLWKTSCKEFQTWPKRRPIILASLSFHI